jgi:phosphoglycerol transferase
MAKGMIQGHWIWSNPNLGMPFGFDLRDLPIFITLEGTGMKFLSFFTAEPGLIVNVTWLAATVLASGSMTWCLQRLSINSGIAISVGVMYALQSYGFYRNIHHLHLLFYLVPFIATGAIELVSGRFSNDSLVGAPARTAGWTRRISSFIPVYLYLACIGMGLSYAYSAFFSVFVLSVATLLALARGATKRELLLGAGAVGIICCVLAINLSPAIYYQAVNGKNAAMNFKFPFEQDIYGLRIAHLLTPTSDHPLGAFVRFQQAMAAAGFQPPDEEQLSKLGVMGSAGFLFLLGYSLVSCVRPTGRNVSWNHQILGASSALALAILLFASASGLAAFFNVFVSPEIRCYSRIAPFLQYFCLSAIAVLLMRAQDWWRRKYLSHVIFGMGLMGIAVLAGMDQAAMLSSLTEYGPTRQRFLEDATFVREIERTLPRSASVFQLPYTPFPIDPGNIGRMAYYDHAKPYLHSDRLRWSWGTITGRAADEWVRRAQALPMQEMLPELVRGGFSGLWVDQFGYAPASSPEKEITSVLAVQPTRSANGRFLFYNLAGLASQLVSQEAKMSRAQLSADSPLEVLPDSGLYGIEHAASESWRWSLKRSRVILRNELPFTRFATFRATLGALDKRHITISDGHTSERIVVSGSYNYTRRVAIPPHGITRLSFVSDGNRISSPDPRALYFKLSNLAVAE